MDKTDIARDSERTGGIRLSRFHAAVAVIFVILALELLLALSFTGKACSAVQDTLERLSAFRSAAADLQAVSDDLSAQAQAFVLTGDPARAEAYFARTESGAAPDALPEAYALLFEGGEAELAAPAVDAFGELRTREVYAMRLAADGFAHSLDGLPAELGLTAPNAEDRLLSPELQRSKAADMLFGEDFAALRGELRQSVAMAEIALESGLSGKAGARFAQLPRLIRWAVIPLLAVFVTAIILVLSTVFLFSRPLRSYADHLRRDELLPESGSRELRSFARSYNQLRELDQRRFEKLSYEATHDTITGVFNRSVFEKLRARSDGRNSAMLIIDIDHFKEINDRLGHDAGDRALLHVSSLLKDSFRAEDYICRIGGDEFAVIMVHTNSSLRKLVENKISRLNEALQAPENGLPPMTLSVGVAFGDRQNPSGDLYKDADTALYRCKGQGMGGCAFY